MGRRGHKRDDDRAQGVGTAVAEPGKERNLHDRVLGLQRDYGNAAVTTIVQRKGGAKGKGKAAAPKEPDFFPAYDASLTGTPGEMRSAGLGMVASDDPDRIRRGIHFYEQAYLRTDGKEHRSDGNILSNGYRKLGKAEQAAWWMKVSSGAIDPFKAEDQHDKGH
jgi:hypothetical protein